MNKKNILTFLFSLIMILGFLGMMPYNSYATQTGAYAHSSNGWQYNYQYHNNNYNLPYVMHNNHQNYARPSYPTLMPSLTTNTRCRINYCKPTIKYNSHIYLDSQLDYVYYNNPQMLMPRAMNNQQRWMPGVSW